MGRICFKSTLGLLLSFLFLVGTIQPLRAEENSKDRTIRVTGEGKVTAVPDQAEINVTVEEEGVDLSTVSASAQDKMQKVMRTLKTSGIGDKDIQTTSYNIQPRMKYDKGESKRTGYTVSNSLKVVVKKIGDAGKILDAVANDGVSRVDGPSFGFSDPEKLQIDALKAAVRDAQAKAEALAQASGADLGKVFSINQTGSNMPSPRPLYNARMMGGVAAANEVPIAEGQNEVTAEVEVVYSLK